MPGTAKCSVTINIRPTTTKAKLQINAEDFFFFNLKLIFVTSINQEKLTTGFHGVNK